MVKKYHYTTAIEKKRNFYHKEYREPQLEDQSYTRAMQYSMGFPLLTAIFVLLKLTGIIKWRWIWVFSPLWGSIGLAVLLIILLLIGLLVDKN